jgi:hypothetical protein
LFKITVNKRSFHVTFPRMYIYIITEIGSLPLFFSFLL